MMCRSQPCQVFEFQHLQSPDLTQCANASHALETFCRQQINSNNNLCIAADVMTGHVYTYVSLSPATLTDCAVVIQHVAQRWLSGSSLEVKLQVAVRQNELFADIAQQSYGARRR